MMRWLVRHAGWLVSKLQQKYDGRIPYQRATGKEFVLEKFEFAEELLYRIPEKKVGFKPESRWLRAVWVRRSDASFENLLLTEKDVPKARAVRRQEEFGGRRGGRRPADGIPRPSRPRIS